MDRILLSKEVFALHTVDGLRPQNITFGTVSMESDKYVTVRDVQPDGQVSLVVADTERHISERHAASTAEGALMNPTSRVLALRIGQQMQVFNIDTRARLASATMGEEVVFWRWINARTIAIIGKASVYHWDIVGDSSQGAPQRVFDRTLDPNVRVLNYHVDASGTWMMINACGQNLTSGAIEGKTQLYSTERGASILLDGFAGSFLSMPTPLDPSNCNIMILATQSYIQIKELPTANKDKSRMLQLQAPIQLSAPNEFPVFVHGTKHNLAMIVSSQGTLSVIDVVTGAVIVTDKVSQSTVFRAVPHNVTGGVQCVNTAGSVFVVALDNMNLIPYIKNTLGNMDLALRVASAAGLSGVDDMFKAQLVELMRAGDVMGAIGVCLRAPNNLLRTPQVLAQFKAMPIGTVNPISAYFKAMMEAGKLNEHESVELARTVTEKAGNAEYIKQQIEQDKFTLSAMLGEIIEPFDQDLALRVYFKAEAHSRVLKILFSRGESSRAVEYCRRVNYTPEWREELQRFIINSPNDAVTLALTLHKDMGPQPLIDPLEVADMFVSQQQVRGATQFLMEVLNITQGPGAVADPGRLQTKLFEINIKHSPPTVAEKIFSRNLYSNYDGMILAPLCERAGLYQRAIECYIKAQYQNPDLDNLSNVRRCLKAADSFNSEWLIDFFGKLSQADSMLCLRDLLEHHQQHFNVIVAVATKYNEGLGSSELINLFLEKNLYDVLFAYLQIVVPYTRDPEVHFRYIEAAIEVGNLEEVERMTKDSPCYDAERTKALVKGKRLSNLWPFINICDRHGFIDEMVRYLVDTGNQSMIEQYVQRRNPLKTPDVIASLMDCDAGEDFIRQVLNAAGSMCPIDELVTAVEQRGRLKLLLPWLEARRNERKTDASLYNALGKIYIDTNNNAEEFLLKNEYYNANVLGKFAENRNTHLAFIAYRRAKCDDEVLALTTKNGMWKEQARYLVQRQDPLLWDKALRNEGRERNHLVEAVHQCALPESKVVDEVITAVKAFLSAGMTSELTTILDQIVLHGEYRKNRHLENLLIISATKARPDKVLEYVNNLENYDAEDIASIATNAGLHEVAFTVYDKHGMRKQAAQVLLHDPGLHDLPRGRAYASKVDDASVWSVLGAHLLERDEISEGIEALLKAKNPDYVAEVTSACERTNQFGDLIKYLMMARVEGKNRNPLIDTYLVLTYAKTGRLGELEDFMRDARGVQVLTVADKCYTDGLYDSARVLYQLASNWPKLTSTLIQIGDLTSAYEAAEKAKNIQTWKELNLACLMAENNELARNCALHIVLRAEELNEILELYEETGHWADLVQVLKQAVTQPGAHMGIYTELGALYARYQPDKLLEHVNQYGKKINTHRLITLCEEYHHWIVLRVLNINNEDWLAAAGVMMAHPIDCWDHEIFKDIVSHLGASDIIYSAIGFYINTHPELLHNYLTAVMTRIDPERVMALVSRSAPLYIIREYLEAIQGRNNKKVNDTLNGLYVEEEDFAALRKSVEQYDNFDSAELAARLETMELFEFRRIALALHRRNKRYSHAITVAKQNNLYQEAIDTAAESKDERVCADLLDYFITERLEDCFATTLYACYDFIPPHVALEKAWRSGFMQTAMPFLINVTQQYTIRLERLEKTIAEARRAADGQLPNKGSQGQGPLMITGN